MGIDQGGKAHEAASRGIGGGKGQRKSPHAKPPATQKVFAHELAFALSDSSCKPCEGEDKEHVDSEADQGGLMPRLGLAGFLNPG